MADFDLRRLDLNLIVVLHAVLEERSVSAAARRLGVTQSAVSQSLAKLRRHFDDDLLVRRTSRQELTARATELRPRVRDVIDRLGSLMRPGFAFDPRETDREFVVIASDYLSVVLGGPLVERLARVAPRARLSFEALPAPGLSSLQEALSRVDGLITPSGMRPPGPSLGLFRDTWALVVDESLAAEAERWSMAEFVARRWVVTEVRGTLPAVDYLRHGGVEIATAVRVQSFVAVPQLVRGTPHVGVVQRRLAHRLAPAAGCRVVEAPWRPPELPVVVFYDELRAHEPAVTWFLGELVDVARSVDAQPS